MQDLVEPPSFCLEDAVRAVHDLVPRLEEAIGVPLQVLDNLEDSSAFAEVSVRYMNGAIAEAAVAVTFSRFGALALVWGKRLSGFKSVEDVLMTSNFTPVRPAELEVTYDGVHEAWSGDTWLNRFFGEP